MVGAEGTQRRAALLRSLCDAGQLVEVDAGALRLTSQGWEFLALPSDAQTGFVFAAWWEGMDWARPEVWRRELWATALHSWRCSARSTSQVR